MKKVNHPPKLSGLEVILARDILSASLAAGRSVSGMWLRILGLCRCSWQLVCNTWLSAQDQSKLAWWFGRGRKVGGEASLELCSLGLKDRVDGGKADAGGY